MPRLPDLALDSLLYTQIGDFITTHSTPEVDEIGRRSFRTEQWQHERLLGSRQQVRLERCTSAGPKQGSLRAVKIVKESRPQGILDFGKDLEVIAKFSHDRYKRWFVKSFGWFEDAGSLFIAMEYCMHGDLRYHLSIRRSLPVTEARQITFQILEALHQMHEQDFAHTDLKPSNVLIKSMPPNENWWVVLADFGISRSTDPNEQPSIADMYTAPELLRFNDQYTPKSISDFKAADMWSLGEIVVRMLTGEAAFRNSRELMEYCSGGPFPFDRFALSVSADGKDFISSLMAVHPSNRSSTAQGIEHYWMNAQHMSLVEQIPQLHIPQNSPSRLTPADILPSPSWTHSSSPEFRQALPVVQRRPVNSSSSQQSTLAESRTRPSWPHTPVESEEKQFWPYPPVETEERQAWRYPPPMAEEIPTWHYPPPVKTEDTRTWAYPYPEAEEKQVWPNPPAMVEEKQVWQNPPPISEEKQTWQNPPPVPEKKQVWQNPPPPIPEERHTWRNSIAPSEEKEASLNQSIMQDSPIVREKSFVSKGAFRTLAGHTQAVNDVAFSPDGKTLISASDDGTVRIWDAQSGAVQHTLQAHPQSVNAVAFSPDGKNLVSASSAIGSSVKLWDSSSGTQLRTIKTHAQAVNTLAFSRDGKAFASASILDGSSIRLWDSHSGEPLRKLSGHSLSVNNMAFSPDNKTLASASNDGFVNIWDQETGMLLNSLWGYSQWVNAVALEPTGIRAGTIAPGGIPGGIRDVAYSPDGETLASASDDGIVRIWDSRSGATVKSLKRKWRWSTVSPVGVNAVSFSPGGLTLASASDDGSIRMWDIRSGTILQTMNAHSKWISEIAFSPDGQTLVSSSHDGTIKLWK